MKLAQHNKYLVSTKDTDGTNKALCHSTRALEATMLSMHPFLSSYLWINKTCWEKQHSNDYKIVDGKGKMWSYMQKLNAKNLIFSFWFVWYFWHQLFLIIHYISLFGEKYMYHTTRKTRTPAFWGYPPSPHDYPYHWVILDPKSKEEKSKLQIFKNSPKFWILKFGTNITCYTPSDVAW